MSTPASGLALEDSFARNWVELSVDKMSLYRKNSISTTKVDGFIYEGRGRGRVGADAKILNRRGCMGDPTMCCGRPIKIRVRSMQGYLAHKK